MADIKSILGNLYKESEKFNPSDLIINPNYSESVTPVVTEKPKSSTLEDKGYEGVQEDDAGYRAAAKYLSNSEPLSEEKQKQMLADYRSGQPVVGKAPAEALLAEVESLKPKVDDTITEASTTPKISNITSILEQYENAKKQRDKDLFVADMMASMGKISQGMAAGFGAKTDGNEDFVNSLRKQAEIPVQDVLTSGKVSDLNEQAKMADPNSDVSKFYRENAAAYAKKAGMSEDFVRSLENMSAVQLEKLGFKGSTLFGKSGRVLDKNIVNPETGKIESVLFDEAGNVISKLGEAGYSYGTAIDPTTGLPYRVSKSNPQAPTATITPPGASESSSTSKSQEYSSPTSLKKKNPKLYEDFKKTQEGLIKDMKDAREVATGSMVLASKLKSGDNSSTVDSGLLGGIQTQAAKMAGQKGVLTDQDLVKFAGAGGVLPKIERIVDGSLFGNMSESDIKFFKRFAEKMEEANREDINNRSEIFVKNIHNEAKDYLPGLTEAQVKNDWLNVNSIAPKKVSDNNKTTIRRLNGVDYLFDVETKKNLGRVK